MSAVDYIGYTICEVIWTAAITIMCVCNSWHVILAMFGSKANPKDSNLKGWISWIFIVSFVCLIGSPIYFFIDFGSGDFGDAAYRSVALSYALGILMAVGFANWCFKIYVYYNRDEIDLLATTINGVFKENSSLDKASWALYFINALAFLALLVGSIVFVYTTPGGIHTGDSINMLLASMILIGCNTLSVVSTNGHTKDKETMDKLESAKVKTELSEKNLPSGFEFGETFSVAACLLHENGKVMNTPETMMKISKFKDNKGEVLSANGEVLQKNTLLGAYMHECRQKINDQTSPFALRVFDGKVYVLKAPDALMFDNYIVKSMDNIIKLPTSYPVGNRLINIYKRPRGTKVYRGDYVLDPRAAPLPEEEKGRRGSTSSYASSVSASSEDDEVKFHNGNSDVKFGVVTMVLDVDKILSGFFVFYEDVAGICDGVAIHCNFSRTMVIPFALYWLVFSIVFMDDTLYGIITWCITFLPALVGAIYGTFSQFWDLFIHTFIIGWGGITLVKISGATTTYVYSNTVWNNTDITTTVCSDVSCTNWDQSTTVYWMSLIMMIVTAAMSLVQGYNFFYKLAWIKAIPRYLPSRENMRRMMRTRQQDL